MARPIFVLRVRAEEGIDEIRALRAWLKIGLRTFGLRCVGIHKSKQQRRLTMDMREYASTYIKPDHVRDGPIQTRIVNVFVSEQYDRPVLELETGSQFTLNDGNTNTLIKAWGHNSDDWIGKELELLLGTWKDWRSDPPEDKETVKVRAISPAKTETGNSGAPNKPPLPASRTASRPEDIDDAIPFILAFFIVSAVTWFVAGGSTLIA
jgi:hypothetical protein